jgi:hypothetical protein
MKAKLIKEGSFGYKIKFYNDDDMAACALGLLSLKNCQAIENGYDLDEMAKKFRNETIMNSSFISDETSFKEGAKAIIELLGDKKFSEEQMFKMFIYGHALTNAIKLKVVEDKPMGDIFNDFIQLLQQTEWDVEIEMEEVAIGDKYTPEPKPKLDKEGCLILKRVV